jgi:hypothetical protein
LLEMVFSLGSKTTLFDSNNTIFIDDSPEKSVCNVTGNAIFIKSWTKQDQTDSFFMDELAP